MTLHSCFQSAFYTPHPASLHCIDATLSMAKHIDHISRSVYFEIRRISSIRHLLTTKATAQLMCSLVLSRLDGCNSLLVDIYCDQIYRLQKVQNNAAKAVFRKNRHKHVRPLLKALHWQPVTREYFEDRDFCFSFSHGTLLPYL